jgi:hypothetical protein
LLAWLLLCYFSLNGWVVSSHKIGSNRHWRFRQKADSKPNEGERRKFMKLRRLSSLIFVTAGAVTVGVALPVLGQQGPESLLPPGFGDPPPPPPPPSTPKTPSPDKASPAPSSNRPSSASSGNKASSSSKSSEEKKEDGEEGEEEEIRYDVPPTARRSLKQIGLMSEASGGLPVTAFGNISGKFLSNVAQKTKGPIASRWAAITARRALASRTNTPSDVNGADWVADRASLILRMGDAVVARQLIQQVDASSYSKRLLEVSMPIYLANADLSGMCPIADAASQKTTANEWKTAQSICASLAGEQGRATSLLNQVKRKNWAQGIDYLLTEKAVGAGTNGRRTVKIEWDKVGELTTWRHGVSQATGVEPPEALYKKLGREFDGWRSQLPMVSIKTRVATAPGAAAIGAISNRAMVDIYSIAAEEADLADDIEQKTASLRTAFVGKDDSAKIAAMKSLWDGASDSKQRHGMMVLTARSAALIAPTSGNSGNADQLIASMLSGGFDTQAARWLGVVDQGSLAWALLATGSPEWSNMVSAGAIDDFQGNDDSINYHKSALLAAGLAGLGRMSSGALTDASSDLEVNIVRETKWSRAIRAAADRGESGTVVLLAAAGLQASDWTKIPAHHLYHIVGSLNAVGLEAEARMIAAEAVSFG